MEGPTDPMSQGAQCTLGQRSLKTYRIL